MTYLKLELQNEWLEKDYVKYKRASVGYELYLT